MRLESVGRGGFLKGFGVGAATFGVALLALEAVRRVRLVPRPSPGGRIDGVRPPDRASLEARPQEEGNAADEPLESEASDYSEVHERW